MIDIDTLAVVGRFDMQPRVYSSSRRVDGRVIFGTSGGRIVEMDVEILAVVGSLLGADPVTNAIAISPDERTIFVSMAMNQLAAFAREPGRAK